MPPPPHKEGLTQLLAKNICSWTLNPTAIPSKDNGNKIRAVCISDTHNTKPDLPGGDILLHAGDLSQHGLFNEIQTQLNWLNAQPHKHKIIIAGNHDAILDEEFVKAHPEQELDKPGKSRGDLDWGEIIYLQTSSVEVESKGRTLKIYGAPLTPERGTRAFQHSREVDVWENTIPDGTDIFLTHGPPSLHLDDGKGSPQLLKEIQRARPKMVVFGHIHEGRGEKRISFDDVQTCYEKVIMDLRPWVNVIKLLWYTGLNLLGLSGSNVHSTHLINAAVVAGKENVESREPMVVYI